MSPAMDGEEPRLRPALIMNIDIGDGRTERLQIQNGDDCDQLAAQFCEAHNLPAEIVLEQLSEHISRSMIEKGLLPAAPGQPQPMDSLVLSRDKDFSDDEDRRCEEVPRTDDKDPRRLVPHLADTRGPPGPYPMRRSVSPDDWGDDVSSEAGSDDMAAKDDHAHFFGTVDRSAASNAIQCNAAYTRFAALEAELAQKKQRTSMIGTKTSANEFHERLYQRGMRQLQERKRVANESGRWTESTRSSSSGKQRPLCEDSPLPGHHMRARARSAPRARPENEDPVCDEPGLHEVPFWRSLRTPFRPGGTPTHSAESIRAQMSPLDPRPKSAPRERPLARNSTPVHERLYKLARKSCSFFESNEVHDTRPAWNAGGTHWERAERDRVERTKSSLSSAKSERSHSSWGKSSDCDKPIHERLFEQSLLKVGLLQQREQARRNEEEEQFKNARKQRPVLSSKSREILEDRVDDSSCDIFDKLYEKGIEDAEQRQQIHQKRMKELEIESLRARDSKFMKGQKVKVFQPDLSKSARKLCRDDQFFDRVGHIVERRRLQSEENKLEYNLRKFSDCTFWPQISKFASEFKRDLKGNPTIHEALFQEAKQPRNSQSAPNSQSVAPKKVVSKEEEQAIVARLMEPIVAHSKEALPEKQRDKGKEKDLRSPWRMVGNSSPHWTQPAIIRAKSPSPHQQRCNLEIGEKLYAQAQISKETKALIAEEHERELYDMSQTKIIDKSQRILCKTREQHLAHIFSELGGDEVGFIRRKTGHLHVNVGDPLINSAVARILLKHFKSSVQKVTFDVFKRICEEGFKVPLKDGLSAWHRLGLMHQRHMSPSLSDLHQIHGVNISFEASGDEEDRAVESTLRNKTSEASVATAIGQGFVKPKTHLKGDQKPDVFTRLSQKKEQKEQFLEAIRQEKIQAEIGQYTFYPQTNRSPIVRQSVNFYERLLEKEKQKQLSLEEARRQKQAEAMRECTFQPNVGKSLLSYQKNSPTYPIALRADKSDSLSTIMDLGSSFVADPFFSSPLQVGSPVPVYLYSQSQTGNL